MEGWPVVVSSAALFVFPGYALLVASGVHRRVGLMWMLSAAGGLSLAVVPVVTYVATLVGVGLTSVKVVVVLAVMGVVCVWDWWRRSREYVWATWRFDGVVALVVVVFLGSLAARIWMVRGLDYPLWTDSYHHTLITELISDGGVVPSSYEPYAPVHRFTYHFGFHTVAAWFHWLTGMPVPRSVVLVGQMINALAVLTGYLLAWRLFRSRLAGLVTALVVGLVSRMPALFVDWGRYPQLSGQVFLPVLMVLSLDTVGARARWRELLMVGLAMAGLFFVHNRVFLFYGVFLVLLVVARLHLAVSRGDWVGVGRIAGSVAMVVGVMAVVAAPWLWRFWQGFGSTVAQELSKGYNAERDGIYFAWKTGYLFDYGMQEWLMALVALGGGWGVLKRNAGVWLMLGWIGGVFLLADCYLVGIAPLWSNLIASKMIYLPASVLIGYLADRLALLVRSRRRFRFFRVAAAGGVVLAAIVGATYIVGLVKPQNGFVRPADLRAMEWIRRNVPEDGLFYICIHFWTPVVAHGLDAGYWIPFLAHRQTVLPPEVYASDGSPDYIEFINRRARDLVSADTSERLWEVLNRYGVSYVYVGARWTKLDPRMFDGDTEHFQALYADGRVRVFRVVH